MKGVPGDESCVRKSDCAFPIARWSFVELLAAAESGEGGDALDAEEAEEEEEDARHDVDGAIGAMRWRRLADRDGAMLLRRSVRANISAL